MSIPTTMAPVSSTDAAPEAKGHGELHLGLVATVNSSTHEEATSITLERNGRRLQLEVPTLIQQILRELASEDAQAPSETAIARRIAASREPRTMSLWARLLPALIDAGWFNLELRHAGVPLVRLESLGVAAGALAPRAATWSPEQQLEPDPLALLRCVEGAWQAENGATRYRTRLLSPLALQAVAAVTRPTSIDDIRRAGGLEPALAMSLARLLVRGGVLRVGDPQKQISDADFWTPWELLFHARSRIGRTDEAYGGGFRFRGVVAPDPAVPAPRRDADTTPLPAVRYLNSPSPLVQITETRASVRAHDDKAPITVAQLGELLHRSQRLTFRREVDGYGEVAGRPYPGGGGLYELEIYPMVRLCDGLEAGLYHYDSAGHALERVHPYDTSAQQLLQLSGQTGAMEDPPQVVFYVTARFKRVMWKYDSVAYAVILKNVGALYQTLYLHATEMGLAPCALGGGDTDLFGSVADLTYLREGTVGEFLIGSKPKGWTRPQSPAWVDAGTP